MTRPSATKIGTAGWALPLAVRHAFGEGGSTLERYATCFSCVEINSTFKRRHRPDTFARWRSTVGRDFRFAVKIPASISHVGRLRRPRRELMAFLDGVDCLGPALGPLLLQLPPSLPFEAPIVARFISILADRGDYQLVCEPRHASWFSDRVDAWLAARRVARVAADPPRAPRGAEPGGWRDLAYFRFHGSPKVYYSAYGPDRVRKQLDSVAAGQAKTAWCIFDNIASGAATSDALLMKAGLS